jgi:hypothetical protein
MNAHAPPKKERGHHTALEIPSTRCTITAVASGPQLCDQTLRRWFAEAQRIASEYHRTPSVRHLRAFCRMIAGIMREIERVLPE